MNNTYIFNSQQIDNAEKFQKYYSCMSDYRKSKIDRMKMEKDKLLSLSAGILLDSCLKKLGLREKSMEYALGKNEKPFFANAQGIYFNISHSGTYAVCSFSENEIGCDIEKIESADIKIAERFFTESEYSYILSGENTEERNYRFIRLWTLKESCLKYKGVGLCGGLNSFEIGFIHNRPVILNNDEKLYLKEYEVDGYCVSVASGSNSFSHSLVEVRL
ncbi:4'-phosphopantetheinyl transferase family protein [Oscillospiraceae bacterium LCP25S3_E10]|nr:4'-phosphopantetheinyl transferase superfamily protein [Ruminococcus sp.]MDD6447701.1 4'-phosphopantetheinyl transferase superfamily protein [Ruminococcus sp.]MDY2856768.1 4'-phosphopantetheinyl transferase superfamily protein [Oscillospiraceae bacterium]